MPVSLAQRPIVITGASSGIGKATAVACAAAGMPVALGARRTDRLEEIAQAIRGSGGRALTATTDVTSPESCDALIQRAAAEFGSVYAVFANAGYGCDSPLLSMEDAELRAIFETNFYGTINIIRPAVRLMRESTASPKGHVLICSSCVARFTIPNLSAYSATKAAQAHVATGMRAELRNEDIHVSSIHPIGVRTEFFDQCRRVPQTTERPHRAPDFFTQDAEYVAARIVQCLRRPVPEVWTGIRGTFTRLSAAAMIAMPRLGEIASRVST